MATQRVLVTDPLDPAGIAALKERGLDVEEKTGLSEAELAAAAGAYDAFIVRSATKITEPVLSAATRLRVIGRAGVGVDNIDEEAATRHGVLVMNTPTGNTLSACEHTLAMILAAARNVPQSHASVKAGRWDRKAFPGMELAGKTLGIIGLGRIGREIAHRAAAFDMRLLGHDPYVSQDAAKKLGMELVDLEELLSRSHIVTIHTPLTDATRNMIDAKRIAGMRRGAILVNVARGGLIDEDALAAALKDGHLRAAALDVFAVEPPTSSPLIALDNVVTTPHLGASTAEAQEKVATQVAGQVADFLLESKVRNATNLAHAPDPQLQPFLDLARAMGSFAVQAADGQPASVTIECRGQLGVDDVHPIAMSALVGILERASDERVNIVNAEQRAASFGISTTQTHSDQAEDYAASVRITMKTDQDEMGLLGVHLARLGARVVEINGYDVELRPTGRFLVVHHRDQPGTVGRIGSILGKRNVNIAQMVVGRVDERGPAVSIIRVDDAVSDEVVAELRAALGTQRIRNVVVAEVPFHGAKPTKDK